jgi:ankyrin repeat protein
MRRFLCPLIAGSLYLPAQATVSAGELYEAALAGDVEAVRTLAATGVDLAEQGDLGTPLHVAAIRGDMAVAEVLITRGADIDAAKSVSGPGRCTRRRAMAILRWPPS